MYLLDQVELIYYSKYVAESDSCYKKLVVVLTKTLSTKAIVYRYVISLC